MKSYETTLIISPETPPEAVESLTEKIKKILSKNGGVVSLVANEGSKKLAYPVSGRTEGVYIYAEYSAPSEALGELESLLSLSDAVIRHLTVVKEKPSKIKPAAPRRPRPETPPPPARSPESPAPSERTE